MKSSFSDLSKKHPDKIVFFFYILTALFFIYYFRSWQLEDALITMRYARNFALGKGLVYNEGLYVQGFTAPLYTIMLGMVYWLFRFSISLPFLGVVIAYLSLTIVAFSVYYFLKRVDYPVIGFVAGLSLFMPRIFWLSAGSEMLFVIALVCLGLFFYSKEYTKCAFFFMGLSVFARMDAILIVGLFLTYHMVKKRSINPGEIFVLILPVAVWLIFARFYFGEFLPNTLAVKMSQYRQLIETDPAMAEFSNKILFSLDYFPFSQYWFMFLFPAGYFLLKKQLWQIKLLIMWGVFHNIVYFYVLRVPPHYFWYHTYITFSFMLIYILGICFVAIVLLPSILHYGKELLNSFSSDNYIRMLFVLVLTLFFLVPVGHTAKRFIPEMSLSRHNLPWYHHPVYKLAAVWINENLSEDYTVASGEIGFLGFYCDRFIYDGCNLINRGFTIENPIYDVYVGVGEPVVDYTPDVINSNYRLIKTFQPEGYPVVEIWLRRDHVYDDK